MIRLFLAAIFLALLSSSASAKHHHVARRVVPTSFGYSSLVERARSYIGTNPTGSRSLWCGKFMAIVAPGAAAKVRNPAWARAWASLPKTQAQIGAIAVMGRRGGGHVGIVSGFDRSGNPIIVSGNNRGAVREGAYPASRVIAYVSAD